MAFKIVLLFGLIAAASAGILAPVVQHEEPANYNFNYEVHDTQTGDIKRQHEVAKDGAISGEYSLFDADGFRRVVTYTADDHHGFQANVQREPLGHKVVAAPVVTKVIQPAVTKVVTPVFSHGWQPNPHASNPWS
ncbi:hypothetical protein ACKWTF_001958 [Chironomus riparius]